MKDINSMTRLNSYLTKGLLLTSGLLAAGIAAAILFAPDAFYASYGIDTGSDVSLANELKAPAGTLFIAGLLMLAGVVRTEFTVVSLGTASLIYLSYGLSRILSMVIDGIPHNGLVGAAVLEIAIGAICLLVLTRHLKPARGKWNTPSEEVAR